MYSRTKEKRHTGECNHFLRLYLIDQRMLARALNISTYNFTTLRSNAATDDERQ